MFEKKSLPKKHKDAKLWVGQILFVPAKAKPTIVEYLVLTWLLTAIDELDFEFSTLGITFDFLTCRLRLEMTYLDLTAGKWREQEKFKLSWNIKSRWAAPPIYLPQLRIWEYNDRQRVSSKLVLNLFIY